MSEPSEEGKVQSVTEEGAVHDDGVEPICGDGMVAGAEECDDGGIVSGDGCSSSCSLEDGLDCVGGPGACGQVHVVYVDQSASGADDGSWWQDAFVDLQEALDSAGERDGVVQVWIAEGIYYPSPSDRAKSFRLQSQVQLFGGFQGNEEKLEQRNGAAYPTILSGNIHDPERDDDNSFHVVVGLGVDSSSGLHDLVIEGGNANLDRCRCEPNGCWAPTLNECVERSGIQDNVGGGLYLVDSSPTVKNVIFRHNSADLWGGGLVQYGLCSNR